MISVRLLHILNAEGDGKEVIIVNGNRPKDAGIKRSALSDIVDCEALAADKPTIWCGRIHGNFYYSGRVKKDETVMPFSYYAPGNGHDAYNKLLADLASNGFNLDEQTIRYFTRKGVMSKAVIGLCIAAIVITGIILIVK